MSNPEIDTSQMGTLARELLAELANVTNRHPTPTIVTDFKEGNIIVANKAACRAFPDLESRQNHPVLAFSRDQLSPDEDLPDTQSARNTIEVNGRVYEQTVQVIKKRVYIYLKDISAREQATQSLNEQRDLNDLLLNAIPHPAMIIDESRAVVAANSAAIKAGAAIGSYCWLDFGQCESLPAKIREKIKAEQVLPGGPVHCHFCLADKVLESGEPANNPDVHARDRIWDIRWIPLQDGLYLRYAIDVTEQRQMEEQVRQMQTLHALGTMAGGVAHDFNNLLMGILGNAHLAVNHARQQPQLMEHLNAIIETSKRAAALISQILAYAGKGTFVIEPVDISNLVSSVSNLLQAAIPKKVQLRLKLPGGLPAIDGDAAQLNQIVMNLVTNAGDSITDEGVIIVTTGVRECDRTFLDTSFHGNELPSGRYVFLEVSDTGHGMDESTKARIFDPFFTTKGSGRGLGLSAVLGIVQGHKGALRIISTPGKRTTFTIVFPPSSQTAAPAQPESHTTGWQGSGKVLVVDDEEIVRGIAQGFLERMGFTVLTANDGQEGVEMFTHHHNNLVCVILDLKMPRKNGTEAFFEMLKINKDVPVIFSSGYNEEALSDSIPPDQIDGFLKKPYDQETMASIIRKVLPLD